jgi:uncharacterized membrane protein YbhN (UPF0104 family)
MAGALLVAVVDRLCGLLGLLGLGALASALGASSPDPRLSLLSRWTWLLATTLAVLVALGLGLIGRSPRLQAALERAPRPIRALAALRPPRSRWRLLAALFSSLLTQGAVVLALVLVVLAVYPALELGPALSLAPWIVLLIFVPITPAGIGQRELVFVELWSLAGVPRNAALGASLLYLAIGLIYAGIGGLLLLLERGRRDGSQMTG